MSLKRNTLWNLAGSGLPLIAALFCIPYLLKTLGNEAFGVLTLIWALIGYFSLFDMGVGRALTYEVSKLRGKNNMIQLDAEIASTLSAGIFLTFITGIFGALLIWLISPVLVTNWLKISQSLQADTLKSFQIAAIGIIPTTITSGVRGALEGLERFAASNINKSILGFGMFILPTFSIMFYGNSLWHIAAYLVLARIFIVFLAFLQTKQYWSLKSKNIYLHIKPLLNYGFWITVTGIVGPLMVYGDRFFVSAAVGAILLPLYAIPQEGLQRLLILPMALCGAAMPKIVQLKQKANGEVNVLYNQLFKQTSWGMLIICALVAILAKPTLAWWINPQFAKDALPIVLVLCIGIWINAMAFVPYTFMHAFGEPKQTAIFHMVELVLYIIALWWLTNHYGLIGAAWAWVGRVLLDFSLLKFAIAKLFENNLLAVR